MKSSDILNRLSDVDPDLVADAAPKGKERTRSRPLRLIALVAAAAIVITAVPLGMLIMNRSEGANKAGVPNADYTSSDDSPTGGAPPAFVELSYLTAREFHSDRTAGAVGSNFRAAYADFALKLLSSCRSEQGSDTLISPLSVMTALAMAANGADGQMLTQMETLLGGGMNVEEINQQLFNLYASLSSTADASFKAANSVWLTSLPIFTVDPDFLKAIENTYLADVLSVDFSDSQQAADAVNYWCWEHTDGMINRVVGDNTFSADTIMALVNALTFDAKWKEPFPTDYNREGVFHGTNGDSEVTMLCNTAHTADYYEGEREIGFSLPYEGGDYAFVALLPNQPGDIRDYLSGLDGDYLTHLLGSPDRTGNILLHITMPAFQSGSDLKLKEILSGMGMPDAFDSSKADFTRMGQSGGSIYIGEVIHKTHIEVTNEGTRAAAVTEISMVDGGMPQIVEITLDRPFVYAIIDTATNLPIFIGSCENVA